MVSHGRHRPVRRATAICAITDRKKEVHRHVGRQEDRAAAHRAALAGRPARGRGRGRGRPAALPGGAVIVPDLAALAGVLGRAASNLPARLADADVRALYQPMVDRANAGLAQFERIKKFALVSAELSAEAGLLTPSLKVKRRVVDERFGT